MSEIKPKAAARPKAARKLAAGPVPVVLAVAPPVALNARQLGSVVRSSGSLASIDSAPRVAISAPS